MSENAHRDKRDSASWSLGVVVGEIRFNVSETTSEMSIAAISGGGANPASVIFSATSVDVLPTAATVIYVDAVVGGFPSR